MGEAACEGWEERGRKEGKKFIGGGGKKAKTLNLFSLSFPLSPKHQQGKEKKTALPPSLTPRLVQRPEAEVGGDVEEGQEGDQRPEAAAERELERKEFRVFYKVEERQK